MSESRVMQGEPLGEEMPQKQGSDVSGRTGCCGQWQSAFDAVSDGVCTLDEQQRIVTCNQAMLKIAGKSLDEVIGRHCWEVVHHSEAPISGCPVQRMRKSLCRESMELQWGDRCFLVQVDPVFDSTGSLSGAVHIISDITERKVIERDREQLIRKLQDALAHVRTLRGLLPICCHCKKIRNDQGYWQMLEVYLMEHSDASFSHSFCPHCAHKLYPDIFGTPPEV